MIRGDQGRSGVIGGDQRSRGPRVAADGLRRCAAPRCCARASNFQSWNAACHRLARSLQFGRQRTGCTRPRQGGARRRCARAEGGEAALGPEGDRPPPLWGCVGCRARPTRAARDKSSEQGLNLSGSWQQGHSAAYNTPFLIQVVCKGFIARGQEIVMAHGSCDTVAHGFPRAVDRFPSGMDSNLEALKAIIIHGKFAKARIGAKRWHKVLSFSRSCHLVAGA